MPQRSTDMNDRLKELTRRLNADVVISAATREDAADYHRLINATYTRHKTDSYYCWRFDDCPDPSMLAVARLDGVLVGCMGGHVRPLTDGRRILFTVDLVVAEHARNRGLHILLESALEEFARSHNAVGLVAFPNPNGTRAHLATAGCRVAGEIQTLVLSGAAAASDTPKRQTTADGRLIRMAKDEAFRNWRFVSNPEYRYTQFVADNNAWAWFKTYHNPSTTAAVIDMVEFDAPDAGSLSSLLAAVRRNSGSHPNAPISLWALPHTQHFPTLWALGFRPDGQPRSCCIRPFSRDAHDLLELTNWDLSQSDCEIF